MAFPVGAADEAAAAPPTRLPRRSAGVLSTSTLAALKTVAFIGAHVPLALAMDRTPSLATVHAVSVFAIGAWWALARDRIDRVVMVVGYIAGAEVLWRMTDAQVNWEYGKYAATALLFLAMMRHRWLRPPVVPFAYFGALLPSMVLTLANEDLVTARQQISFNLSGPLALMTCAWFFSKIQLSTTELRKLFIAVIAPVVGVAALAAFGTFFTSDVVFTDNSNFATSGGFGPNQVSGVLGFGALLALFLVLDGTAGRFLRVVMCGAVAGLAAQSALTFSRGGLYMAVGGAAVGACFAMKDARMRGRLIPLLAVLLVVGNYFVVPYLNAFTGGQIGVRFQDTELTGRDRMIEADIEMWKEHPIFGVGPGQAAGNRGIAFRGMNSASSANLDLSVRSASHTEFSRLLAEHGVFGFGALLLFVAGGIANVVRAKDVRARTIVAGLTCWTALFMFSYAMRVLAPSFAFGFGFATLIPDALPTSRVGPRLRPLW